jgi:hypothetical protein
MPAGAAGVMMHLTQVLHASDFFPRVAGGALAGIGVIFGSDKMDSGATRQRAGHVGRLRPFIRPLRFIFPVADARTLLSWPAGRDRTLKLFI